MAASHPGYGQSVPAAGNSKELKTLLARDEELDGLFERIYEDNVSGKLSDDRFAKMSRRYEDEQKELAEKIKKLRSEIEKQSSRSMTTLHTAVASGSWCGAERQRCGASGSPLM